MLDWLEETAHNGGRTTFTIMNSETSTGARSGSSWLMVWGIVMLICGIIAIAMPWWSGIGVVIIVGWVLIFSAVSHLILAFQTQSVGGFFWQLLLAIIYGAAGVYMLMNPLLGLVTLTLVLAIFLLMEAGPRDRALFYDSKGG
jgi:uncharacterized membrane protein HdeD (DUF308 family)